MKRPKPTKWQSSNVHVCWNSLGHMPIWQNTGGGWFFSIATRIQVIDDGHRSTHGLCAPEVGWRTLPDHARPTHLDGDHTLAAWEVGQLLGGN